MEVGDPRYDYNFDDDYYYAKSPLPVDVRLSKACFSFDMPC